MLYLDDSVLRKAVEDPPDPTVAAYLRDHATEPWAIPATVAWEYLSYYADDGRRRDERRFLERTFEEIAPIDLAVAAEAATLRARLDAIDRSLQAADLLHLATARCGDGRFVTADRDFDAPELYDLLDLTVLDVA
ncbi:type II toxin-antitoxin system VapC family toxin [Halococcoides cellulosivorans]|uniref:type II toxin-antitoxin system VapC family toxin n=1 Tax=Halococcoides cellulosivorans TaxID=1679096 RepID=UPI00131F0E6A|nr:PIN domain-containing protein [Halococcoides cellulosivorans]